MINKFVQQLRSVGRDYDFHENAFIYKAADMIESQAREIELLKYDNELLRNLSFRDERDQLRKDLAKDRHYFLTEISRLHSVLAEREAEIAKIREALEEFPTSFHILPKNESCKCSQCNALRIKQEALSTPPSTSYLEQWEKEKYGEPTFWAAGTHPFNTYAKAVLVAQANMLPVITLYVRKG